MRRHPSWDAPPPVPPRESAGQDHQHEIQWANPPRQMTGRLRSSSDYVAHPATAYELFGPSDPREKVSDNGLWAAPPPRPPRLNRSISHSPTVSPYAGSVGSDISSQSSGAHPTIPSVATSRTTVCGSTISATGRSSTQAAAPGGKVKKRRIRIKTERRREQCRRNQARYRNKQKFSALELESTVERLRREVEQLQEQHAQSLHREPTRDDPEVVVRETFRMFRFGLNIGRDQSVLPPFPGHLPPLDHQIAFVTSAFDPDLRLGDLRGRTHFLEQLRRFSTLFDDYETILDPMVQSHTDTQSSHAIIQSTFRLDVTVSTTTLRFVFPHLVRAEHHEIRWKLLGQRLRCEASAVFVFDPHGYIADVSWTVDWIAALQTVLTIEETAIALQQAQIGKDALLTVAGEEVGAAARATSVRSSSRLDGWSRWGGHHQHGENEELKEQKDDGVELHDGEPADYYFML